MRLFNRQIILLGILVGLLGGCATNEVQTPPPAPLLTPSRATVPSEPWLLVDTKADNLVIMRGQQPVQVFHQVALGSSGAGLKFRRGDNKTPLGVFRVGWINDHSRFKKFIGLDYPNLDYAEQALREHRIDRLTYERIRAAWISGRTPPQDTPLGGQIGIHGIGFGDPSVHSAGINWTSGCVALDNRQIDALRPWVRVGMRVEIR
ncbi:MAG: L,D-transpeptidase [Gammaproteobacteria bacterium]|nr:L,D-transpeptidase [Gammaproteobacteria bacterium]